MKTLVTCQMLLGALAAAGTPDANAQPVLTHGHVDVGIAYEAGAWDLHVHDEGADLEYAPDAVVLRAGHASRTEVPGDTRYRFLGQPGSPLWILPETANDDLLFLGLGAEEIESGTFADDQIRLSLVAVHGPGNFFLYTTDPFGNPVVAMNSADGIDATDRHTLLAGSHSHANWAFTAPGAYHVVVQASGVLVDGGAETTSEPAEYHFRVAPETRLQVAETGASSLRLTWTSEAGVHYQLQQRHDSGEGWEDVGSEVEGTGSPMEIQVPTDQAMSWFRLEIHDDGHATEGFLGRLLVADAEEAHLSVIDLETGAVHQDEFELTARASSLRASPSGRFGFTVETDGDLVQIFDGGIYVEDHGDHLHAYEKPLSKLALSLAGAGPVHIVSRGEWIAVHHDGVGKVSLVHEPQLAALGDAYEPRELFAGLQHGAAVPLDGDRFAVTMANPDYPATSGNPLPIGAAVHDLEGNIIHAAPGCQLLHGEAGNGHTAAFGCADGVLVIEAHDDHFHDALVPNPETLAAPLRIGELRGHDAHAHYFGHATAEGASGGLFLISPEAGTMTPVPTAGDSRPVAFEFTPDGHELLVVLASGDLLELDAVSGSVVRTLPGVITPVTNHANHGQHHPAVTAGMGMAYVSDPAGERIVEIDLAAFAIERTFHVHGLPAKLALLGVLQGGTDHDHD
ncbi:MAG: TIGR03769 domain-containing protein [Verrucomicrobiales bacterium]|nr:TIGR03769 domain-containing protein [Verrucomicrobiales bacterium]